MQRRFEQIDTGIWTRYGKINQYGSTISKTLKYEDRQSVLLRKMVLLIQEVYHQLQNTFINLGETLN